MSTDKQRLFAAPRQLVTYLLIVEACTTIGIVGAFAYSHWSPSAAAKAALILVLAIVFEEVTRKFGTLRVTLSGNLKPDMTSVWSFSAAVTLPPAYVVAAVSALLLYMWLRIQRPAGEAVYRKIGTGATILAACLVAYLVIRALGPTLAAQAHSAGDALAVIIGLGIYTATNRLLVTGALYFLGARGRDLIGSQDDNLIELATLCLGGLTAVALFHQPWLAVLVLLPMSLLQRSAVVRQLEIAATTDAKTGLWTAIAWEELSQRELARAHRDEQPVALLMLDVDRFKAVNDTYGHLVGDIVLKAVGTQLKTELRGYDLVGRLGGEEFVALLPGVDQPTALAIAERLRAGIAQVSLTEYPRLESATTSTSSVVTVSIGVACSQLHGAELTALLHASDGALYTAKNGGRNQVRLAATSRRRAQAPDLT